MTKIYIVSEEVLRQVMDALERGVDIASDRNVERNLHIPIVNAFENLRTILASPPAEPVAHMYPSTLSMFEDNETFGHAYSIPVGSPSEESVPLYRKDT